jgi:arabinofuranosyltransferase
MPLARYEHRSQPLSRWLIATTITLLLSAAALNFILTLWMSDDAAITYRTVLNFVEGYGARFNVEERVQAYTHPLWFLLVTVFTLIVAHPVHAAWIVSAVCIVATYAIVWRFVLNDWVLFAVFVALCLASKSVSDFANSGLENPLSHLAIAIVFALAVRRRADAPSTLLMIVCSGTYLIRPDLVVLVAPLVSLHVWKLPNIYLRLRAVLAFAMLPALWTGLSLVYYGFPFPNTAYAKLYVAIDPLQKFAQGSWYFIDSLNRDPITLVTITTGVVLGILGAWYSFVRGFSCVGRRRLYVRSPSFRSIHRVSATALGFCADLALEATSVRPRNPRHDFHQCLRTRKRRVDLVTKANRDVSWNSR